MAIVVGDTVIKTICILHNTIIDKEGHHSFNGMDVPQIPSQCMLRRNRANNPSTRNAKTVRDTFAEYFSLNA
ncbi:hypothetical protein PPYR_02671 [Photinus pyralis]|uniref:Uncharacterized protein n=1 Tax=Photinus pyralis TaxID=7054 RepID=A0A5N4B2G1_PHOPY|nr:hypothetical protein PPYR_00703 [Photinus pyralis]KAB0805701.1 hypothetical protein PPYR_02671 [Photinus pyralis]